MLKVRQTQQYPSSTTIHLRQLPTAIVNVQHVGSDMNFHVAGSVIDPKASRTEFTGYASSKIVSAHVRGFATGSMATKDKGGKPKEGGAIYKP